MPSNTLRRIVALEDKRTEKEDTLIRAILDHMSPDELMGLVSLVDKTGGNGAMLNNDVWMLAELTPHEIEVRNRYAKLWNEMGGW